MCGNDSRRAVTTGEGAQAGLGPCVLACGDRRDHTEP